METTQTQTQTDAYGHAKFAYATLKAVEFSLERSRENLELARQFSQNPSSVRAAENLVGVRQKEVEDWRRIWAEASAALTPELVDAITSPPKPDPDAARKLLAELALFDWRYARSDDHAYWREQNDRWHRIEELARQFPDGAAVVESRRPRMKQG